MARDSILFIPFILFILSNSFCPSYALSEPHNHTPQFGRHFRPAPAVRLGEPRSVSPTTSSLVTVVSHVLKIALRRVRGEQNDQHSEGVDQARHPAGCRVVFAEPSGQRPGPQYADRCQNSAEIERDPRT